MELPPRFTQPWQEIASSSELVKKTKTDQELQEKEQFITDIFESKSPDTSIKIPAQLRLGKRYLYGWGTAQDRISAIINLEEVSEQDIYPSFKEEARILLQKYEKTLIPEIPGSIQNIQINFASSPPKAFTDESLEQFSDQPAQRPKKKRSSAALKTLEGSLLLKAIENNDTNSAINLIKEGAILTIKEPRTQLTLLALAAKNNNFRIVQSLLSAGANPNLGDESRGALAQASDPNIIQLLLMRGAIMGINRALLHASARGDAAIAQQLIQSGANVNFRECDNNCTPLTLAANTAITQLLLSLGASIGMEAALIRALAKENFEQAQLLLNNGARVNFSTQNGDNPLENAIKTRNIPAIRWLIAHRASRDTIIREPESTRTHTPVMTAQSLPEATPAEKESKIAILNLLGQ